LTRSISQETENSSSGSRKNAPTRAVFHDLTTAHSSITSGTARIKGRDTSTNLSEVLDEEDSIVLQELDPSTRPIEFLKNLPLPPPPAIVPEIRCQEFAEGFGSQERDLEHNGLSSPTQLEARAQQNSMFTTIKNALVSISSPITANERSSAISPSNWLKNNLDFGGGVKHRGSLHPPSPGGNGPQTPLDKARNMNLGQSGGRQSSDGYSGDLSSIYHSSHGEAPSGSVPPSSSRQDGSIGSIETTSLLRPNRIAKRDGFMTYNEAVQFEDFSSSPPGREQSLALPRQKSRFGTQSDDGSSLPEGSTIGNIYKAYIGSDGDDEQSEFDLPRLNKGNKQKYPEGHQSDKQGFSSNSRAAHELQPSALNIRKQRRAERLMGNPYGEPPKFGLPAAPSLAAQHIMPSSSQGLGHSSSYGDTNNLLDITQPGHWTGLRPGLSRSDARNDLRSDRTSPEDDDSSPPTMPTLRSNNPFPGLRGPQVIISQPTDGDQSQDYSTARRQPLERDVSNALRRVSAFSTYSDGSIASGVLRYADFDSELPSSDNIGNLRRQNLDPTPASNSENAGRASSNGAGQVQGFYNQVAIAPNWINNQQNNAIRVPINYNGFFPSSPPRCSLRAINPPVQNQNHSVPRETDDDVNDWETVGESRGGREDNSNGDVFGMLGGTVGQAGSSIANTSDDGTVSSGIPEMGDYGSTERFVQHPGNIGYHGEYRMRDLKDTNTPVFLPKFREHKVNGYLADSNRVRPPPNPYSYNPRPLDSSHTNPFSSPPPERMPTQKAKPSPVQRNHQSTNQAPLSMKTLDTTQSEISKHNTQAILGSTRVNEDDSEWMDDFGEPGPAIRNTRTRARYLSSERPSTISSFEHCLIFARGEVVPGYNSDGTRIMDSSLDTHDPPVDSKSNGRAQTDGFVEAKSNGKDRALRTHNDHKPLVQGPPGTFFRDLLRPKPNAKSASQSQEPQRPSKTRQRQSSVRDYPTNSLRPLSLVQDCRPMTPSSRHTDGTYEWAYRSPLAPPKRQSSRVLYSNARLAEIDEEAQNDHLYEGQLRLSDPLPRSINSHGSQQYLHQSPRILSWSRDSSALTELSERKWWLSFWILVICNCFPPLLFFYAIGKLDGVAVWWTSGEITRFGKGHKRAAYINVACWVLIIFLALVGFLVYWFAFGRVAH
jgi:hypothetical protein